MTRVLHVVRNLEGGGLEQTVLALAEAQRRAGLEPVVLELVEARGARLAVPDGLTALARTGRGRCLSPMTIVELWRTLRRQNPDLVHVHNMLALDFMWIPCLAARLPLIMTKHGGYFASGLQRRLHGSPKHVVCVSGDILARLLSFCPNMAARASVVFNGVGADLCGGNVTRADIGVSEADCVFVWAGRMVVEKGLEFLLRAWRMAVDSGLPGNARLVLVGDGPLRSELAERSREWGLDDGVRFLGWRPDVRAVLGLSDVFVLPSLTEGLPMALLEAGWAGVPCLASRVGGVPDVVRHGENGWLVEPSAVEPLAACLREAAETPQPTLREMGERARCVVKTRFSIEICERAYADVYRSAGVNGL